MLVRLSPGSARTAARAARACSGRSSTSGGHPGVKSLWLRQTAILYLIVSAAVMGMVPRHALVGNGAPFVTAFETISSHGAWAGKLVAAEALISGIGTLNGWTLVTAEASRAPANDDLFPHAFTWTDRKDNAWFGIVIGLCRPRC